MTFGNVKLVGQLHDGGDAGVEVPTALEIVTNPLDGLMQLALYLAGPRRQWGCGLRLRHAIETAGGVAGNKPIDAAQEALDTFDPLVLPVKFPIRRGGEQR